MDAPSNRLPPSTLTDAPRKRHASTGTSSNPTLDNPIARISAATNSVT
jgi:hypothetical protein